MKDPSWYPDCNPDSQTLSGESLKMHPKMTDQQLVEAVAQEVMGWGIFDASGERWICTNKFCSHDKESGCQNGNRIQGPGDKLLSEGKGWEFWKNRFKPLTDANHWMMVVERMRVLGWAVKTWAYSYSSGGVDSWKCHFIDDVGSRRGEFKSINRELGRAVCDAALMAVRGDQR